MNELAGFQDIRSIYKNHIFQYTSNEQSKNEVKTSPLTNGIKKNKIGINFKVQNVHRKL